LEDALRSGVVNFVEADVMMAEDGKDVVMAHPPDRSSDLGIRDFLDAIAQHNSQTASPLRVKLDFKEPQTLKPSLEILGEVLQQRGAGVFPEVWLNADVLQGPGGSESSFDADAFCSACNKAFPSSVLSLGWRVSGAVLEGYTASQAQVAKLSSP